MIDSMANTISIVIPARNEASSLRTLLPKIMALISDAEVIVVDDGSEDDTQSVCAEFPVRVISHPYAKGNGAAIKTGAQAQRGEVMVFLDADGQHQPEDILAMLGKFEEGWRHGRRRTAVRIARWNTSGLGQ
ncbi:glycosyltransferase family 2 protein [Propionivibrio sp.]|uniref:glycosyltransferase family 2 protein n=1 Tax=Propionivibrio sp. TaxID=2212460 RepID=UPI0025FC0E34|nr:glycosyltransferase family 2 protein [Propionivibrio sp.]